VSKPEKKFGLGEASPGGEKGKEPARNETPGDDIKTKEGKKRKKQRDNLGGLNASYRSCRRGTRACGQMNEVGSANARFGQRGKKEVEEGIELCLKRGRSKGEQSARGRRGGGGPPSLLKEKGSTERGRINTIRKQGI